MLEMYKLWVMGWISAASLGELSSSSHRELIHLSTDSATTCVHTLFTPAACWQSYEHNYFCVYIVYIEQFIYSYVDRWAN